jgi:hypothetical protein
LAALGAELGGLNPGAAMSANHVAIGNHLNLRTVQQFLERIIHKFYLDVKKKGFLWEIPVEGLKGLRD